VKVDQIPITLKLSLWSAPSVFLFFLSSVSDAFNLTKLMLLAVIASTALLIFLLEWRVSFQQNSSLSVHRKEISLYLIFILAVIVVGLISTPNVIRYLWGAPGRANGVLYYFSVVGLSLITLLLMRIEYLGYFTKLLKFGFVPLIIYSLIQFLGLDPIQWSNPYNPIIGTLGNPNFSAAALAVAATFYFALVVLERFENQGSRGKATLALNIGMGSLSAFLSWRTNSLQGPLIFIAGLTLIVVYLFSQKLKNVAARGGLFILGILVGLFVLISMAGYGPLGTQLEQYTLKLRGIYAYVGFQAMLASPLHGYGVDSYLIAFREFRTEDFVREYGTGTLTNNAHSTPFQIGSTFGAIVFIVYFLIQIIILTKAIRILIKNQNSTNRKLEIIAILWLLIFAQSLLSIEQIGLGILNWILGAIIISCHHGNSEKQAARPTSVQKKLSRRVIKGIGFSKELSVLLLAFFVIPMTFLLKQDSAWRNVVALEVQNMSEKKFIEDQLSRMHKFVLSEPEKLGPILPKLQSVGLMDKITILIDDALRVNPRDFYAHEMKSQWYRNQQDPTAELAELNIMTTLDPLNSSAWFRKGEVYSLVGNKDLARNAFTRAISISGNDEVVAKAKDSLLKLG